MVLTDSELTVHDKKVTTEAPIDGKQYARKDGDWSEVEASGGASTTYKGVGTYTYFGNNGAQKTLGSTTSWSGYPGTWRVMGYGGTSNNNSAWNYHLSIRIS